MNRILCCWLGISFLISNASYADPVASSGFALDKILDQIDGQTPKLETIKNPDFGFGVIAVSVDNEIVKILKLTQQGIEPLASSYIPKSIYAHSRFDWTGIYDNDLFITVLCNDYCHENSVSTTILRIKPDGTIINQGSIGSCNDLLGFVMEFSPGVDGYSIGAYLLDGQGISGSSFYYLDNAFTFTKLGQNLLPAGRSDLDACAIKYDLTGRYGSLMTIADTDLNDDNVAVIYQLLPDLTWTQLTTPVNTSVRHYEDMDFSPGGSFGEVLYVTDKITESVVTVDPNGVHYIFASGFTGISAISVSQDGNNMFVSDVNGIYRIYENGIMTGPKLQLYEPKVKPDGVHTNPSGIDNVRLIFNEKIIFSNEDIMILDSNEQNIPFSVSGSNSQFMIMAFGNNLLNDKYTITIYDSVVSAETGNAIDGDQDGTAGGNAVLQIEHRERHDSDNDNDIDLSDLADLASIWLWNK